MQIATVWTGLQWSGSQAATATVHLGQLDAASKPGRPQSNGFTGDIVVCVVSNQQRPLLGSAAAEAAERVTWQQASTAEACLNAVWSSPNVYVMEPQASGMEVMRC